MPKVVQVCRGSQNSLIIKRISLDLFSWFRKSSSPIPKALQQKSPAMISQNYAPASFFSAAIRCSCRCLCATTPLKKGPHHLGDRWKNGRLDGVPVRAVVGGVRDDAADHVEESFAQRCRRRDVVQLTHLSTQTPTAVTTRQPDTTT